MFMLCRRFQCCILSNECTYACAKRIDNKRRLLLCFNGAIEGFKLIFKFYDGGLKSLRQAPYSKMCVIFHAAIENSLDWFQLKINLTCEVNEQQPLMRFDEVASDKILVKNTWKSILRLAGNFSQSLIC